MSFIEKLVFFVGLIITAGTPMLTFGLQKRFWLMGIYIFAVILGFAFLHIFLCKHCMNFACPMNAVKKKDREEFFDKNPVVKEAWKK